MAKVRTYIDVLEKKYIQGETTCTLDVLVFSKSSSTEVADKMFIYGSRAWVLKSSSLKKEII